MAYIPFSHNYDKFRYPLFATIRRGRAKRKVGDRVMIRYPDGAFPAVVVGVMITCLRDLPTLFLKFDTAPHCHFADGADDRDRAINVINSFYSKGISDDEAMTVYFLLKTI